MTALLLMVGLMAGLGDVRWGFGVLGVWDEYGVWGRVFWIRSLRG